MSSSLDNQGVSLPPMAGGQTPTCTARGFQRAIVCVPVTVRPFATPGTPIVRCCGAPDVSTAPCADGFELNGFCTFTIRQEICVEVPVDIGATVDPITQTYVACQAPSNTDCTGCGDVLRR